MGFEQQLNTPPLQYKRAIPISAPVSGQCNLLSHTQDTLVSTGAWGPGAAIITSANKIISPFHATIIKIDALDYAVEIKSTFGLKCRIKYGYDTTKLHGEQFAAAVQLGDRVAKGQTLFSVNTAWLKQKGVENICIMTILNAQALIGVLPNHQKHIDAGSDTLLTLYL